ncbi:glycosyltransferase family 4 protein [Spirochaeta isovalerica]|uniref:Glycosyltransferase involved in cell wall biosynthesis n=1 Tax=Spirochaeta isovalerica TaxID=150 RepID=A0A841RAX9_9SPIO|nr:glycosyltransferase family 4 protein [Spirochaeta isovalerica]MBB6481083.1 glycosyltransferase involved in cell wall biosynthesis [Spirochaeta isovalerica]
MEKFRICFVSGKLGDVDGVSLEVDKWIEILTVLGHEIFAIAGSFSSPLKKVPKENCLELPSIRFDSEEQRYFEKMVFPHLSKHPPHLSLDRRVSLLDELVEKGTEVASTIYEFIQKKEIDVLIGENTNAMPMSLLAGTAIHKLATEKRMAVIFHHHDFWWERSRFSHNHIESFLNQIMPPTDLGVEHVVISSYAEHILRSIKRVIPHVVYNCEDFDNPPVRDEYNSHFREDFGFSADDLLFIQPTRVVPRKRIEDSVELVSRYMKRFEEDASRVHFIISLYEGDETDNTYLQALSELALNRGVRLHFIADRVESARRTDPEKGRIYTNRDVLVNADLVTYLPIWEGFGNALLEAVAAKVPIVTTTYLVYKTDIKMCGFRNVEIRDNYSREGELIITEKNLTDMNKVLNNGKIRQEMVETNFRIASKEFSFRMLRKSLERILSDYGDEIKASAKRLKKSKKNYYV